MTENDKQIIIESAPDIKQIIQLVDTLIKEGDGLLGRFRPVDFNDFGAPYVDTENIKEASFAWSRKVGDMFGKVFCGQDSNAQANFNAIYKFNRYAEYLTTRDTLVEKLSFIKAFRKDLDEI